MIFAIRLPEAGMSDEAERIYQDAARYLLDNGWTRDGDDYGLWLSHGYFSRLPIGQALVVQWERDGVSMLSAVDFDPEVSGAPVPGASGTALTPLVLAEVRDERERQERKGAEHRARGQEHWRSCADPLLPTERKLAILGEEYGEVAKALNEEWIGQPANVREELIHTAAVAVAWAESLAVGVSGGTPPRPSVWTCPGCGESAGTWFDRSLCAEPCDKMHTRCAGCGTAIDGCSWEAASGGTPPPSEPERGPDADRWAAVVSSAAQATPGPWRYGYPDGSGRVEAHAYGGTIHGGDGGWVVGGGRGSWGSPLGVLREADAEFIVAVANWYWHSQLAASGGTCVRQRPVEGLAGDVWRRQSPTAGTPPPRTKKLLTSRTTPPPGEHDEAEAGDAAEPRPCEGSGGGSE